MAVTVSSRSDGRHRLVESLLRVLSRANYRLWYLLAIPAYFLLFTYALPLLVMGALLLVYRVRTQPVRKYGPPLFVMPDAERKTLTLRDGVKITYYVIKGRTDKVMVFAAGTGCASSFKLWAAPILNSYGDEFTYIYWEYRGLFDSQPPKRLRRLAIIEHAEDLDELLDAEQIERMDVLVGHSMGGMVALEYTAIHPERVDSLVLLNTAHGKVFSSCAQPLFRVPFIALFLQYFCMAIISFTPPPHRNHLVYVTDSPVWKFARQTMRGIMHVYVNLFGSESLRQLLGPHYLNDFFELYVIDTMRSPQHFATFMRLFEEMDSWSIYHLLPRIQHPILVVAGIWDPLTPAYHAFEMAEALPNAKLVVSYASSHLTLLEQPGLCMRHIKEFVQKTTPNIRFRRRSDIMFVK